MKRRRGEGGIIKTVPKKRKKWPVATCSAQFAGSRNKIMAIYAAIFPPGDGGYEERPRDPYARGRQHKEPPQFTWERFPVHILFCLSRLFSTFRFSFFHPSSTLCFSLSLQSLTLRPSFHPCFGFFTPHSVHAGAFTFDESRWNYPLHSRGQWSSSSSAG